MHIKILRNCFHAAFVIIVMLCFCGNVFGAPIIYSDTSIHMFANVYGTDAGIRSEHLWAPDTTASVKILTPE